MLKFNINAFSMIEDVLGDSLVEIMGNQKKMERVSTMRVLYWAGSLHENSAMSLSDAGRKMQAELDDGKTLSSISEEIAKAMNSSGIVPKAEESPNLIAALAANQPTPNVANP